MLLAAAVTVVCLFAFGCGEKDTKKEENHYLKAAEDAISRGRFDEAITNLEKSLRLNPDEAEAYLKLALIYENIRVDRYKAKKYYEKYIETEKDLTLKNEVKEWLRDLESENSDRGKVLPEESTTLVRIALEHRNAQYKREIEENRGEHQREIDKLKDELETAKRQAGKIADDVSLRGDSAEAGKNAGEIDALKKQIKNLRSELEVIKENEDSHIEELATSRAALRQKESEYTDLSKRFSEMQKNCETAFDRVKQLDKEEAVIEKPTSTERLSTRTDVRGIKTVRGNIIYYSVQQGDTLRRIAEKFYGDKKKWTLIFTANRDHLTDENDIKFGDTIKIPVLK